MEVELKVNETEINVICAARDEGDEDNAHNTK